MGGKYALLEKIGTRRRGDLFRANDFAANRPLTVTLLPQENDDSLEGFNAAMRMAAAVIHPHLLALYDSGDYRGRPYIVQQLVDGASITEAELSLRDAVAAVRDAALALDQGRQKGLIHGAVRPESILVARANGFECLTVRQEDHLGIRCQDVGILKLRITGSGA